MLVLACWTDWLEARQNFDRLADPSQRGSSLYLQTIAATTACAALFVADFLVAWLFFRKHWRAPKLLKAWLLLQLSFKLAVLIWLATVIGGWEVILGLGFRDAIVILLPVIWLLYFSRSKRVKQTFSRPEPLTLLTPRKRPLRVAEAAAVPVVAVAIALGAAKSFLWPEEEDWMKSPPPVWAFLGTSQHNWGEQRWEQRWFLNTQALRKQESDRTVQALLRSQVALGGEPSRVDVPKNDDYTAVQNFQCRAGDEGYDVSATMWYFSGLPVPNSLPSDSELRRVFRHSDFLQISPGTIIARARVAACALAGYK
jgi:hypothetical protein